MTQRSAICLSLPPKRLGLANEKAYLRTAFPEGTSLSSAHVSPSACSGLEAALEECLVAGGCLDVAPLLPSALSGEDVEALLAMALARMTRGGQLRVCGGGAAVVSEALIKVGCSRGLLGAG